MKKALLLACLSVGLSACTITLRSGPTLSTSASHIRDFRPERGESSSYYVGENVRFRLTTGTAGYVTLVSLDPDGYGNVLVRDAYVNAGTTVFPRAQDAVNFTVAPPRGLQRVRAIFTRTRPASVIVFTGRYDANTWNTHTNAYATTHGTQDRDVWETYFYIR